MQLETVESLDWEWISNCFFCIQNAKQGIKIYRDFFTGALTIGKNGLIFEDGFVVVPI